ncbi:hypothetical protein ACLOAU_13515 [Niabella sp. CJ426]|uniref:hypothetical protein n=1 Tax=unclassified Niabella TaxID=2646634 RepID=UPI003CFF4780
MKKSLYLLLGLIFFLSACKKNDYYKDSGVLDPTFNGSILDYLQSKPAQFDSVAKLVRLTGMENVFQNEEITFFAPSDSSVRLSINTINLNLAGLGMEPITRMDQIKPSVWKSYLSLYIFKGAKSLNDYPQIDMANLSAFGGQVYDSYGGYPMNIGVIYGDAGGIQYAGYRMLSLSYIASLSSPKDVSSWVRVSVASSNIHPRNGYVHALKYGANTQVAEGVFIDLSAFGFRPGNIAVDAVKAGINY